MRAPAPRSHRRRGKMPRRGLFLADVVIGLALLTVVAVLFTVAVGRQRRAGQRLADHREATRLAEAALTSLQAGRAAAPQPPATDAVVTVREVVDAAPSSPNTRWAEARVEYHGRTVTLVGPVPAGSVAAPSAPPAPTTRKAEP